MKVKKIYVIDRLKLVNDILDVIGERHITQKQLAEELSIPVYTLNRFLETRQGITDDRLRDVMEKMQLETAEYMISSKRLPKRALTKEEKEKRKTIAGSLYGTDVDKFDRIQEETGFSNSIIMKLALKEFFKNYEGMED